MDHLYELFVPKHLIHLKLFHLILDPALRSVDLPCLVADRESILLVYCDLCFHDELTAQEDVEYVWGAS